VHISTWEGAAQPAVDRLDIVHNVRANDRSGMRTMTSPIDSLDGRILTLLREEPRIGVLEISRRLGVARGTVTARLEKLQARGVVTGFGPDLDPEQMGYPVLAFVFLEIVQGRLDEAVADLRAVPEVLEAHSVTGARDLLCRVVARDNGHLQDVINRMVRHPAVRRSTSYISMSRQIAYRVAPLLEQAAAE
jgi:DNA-binding Lrp family transcriptional regulator